MFTKAKAQALKAGAPPDSEFAPGTIFGPAPRTEPAPPPAPKEGPPAPPKTLRITGSVPVEVWNRLGTKLIPKLKGPGIDIEKLAIDLSITVEGELAKNLISELRQTLADLDLAGVLEIRE